MKKLKKLSRVYLIYALIGSLIQISFLPMTAVYAQQMPPNNNYNGQPSGGGAYDVLALANMAVGVYGQYLGAKGQMVQMQIQTQRNQQMMMSMSPQCVKPDGTSCFTIPGKLFPECPIPASMATMPQNVCPNATTLDPNQIGTMISYEAIASSWMNYYDQMSNEASNQAVPTGLKCLQEKQKAVSSQLIEMINNLTRLQDQLNKDKETFRNNNKKIVDELSTTNDELFGGNNKNNVKLKTMNFSNFFTPDCQSALGKEALETAPTKGFNGLLQSMVPKNKAAADFVSNRQVIERDVRRDIEKKQLLIQNSGLDDWMRSNTEISKVKAVEEVSQKQMQEFTIARERIKRDVNNLVGYNIPSMDKNFNVDSADFLNHSADFFKKQYINECVTGADKSGIALSSKEILGSLEQKSTNNDGIARDMYRRALKNILDSDSFIQDKLKKIKELENEYKGMSVTYQDANAQIITETPYDLYMRTISRCESRLNQNDTFSAQNSRGVSQKVKIERAQNLLRELKDLHDNYASNLGQKVLERVLNCDGESKKAGDDCSSILNHNSDSFCISKANQCSSEIQGCYAQVNTQVENRKNKMQNLAKSFNANAEVLVAHSNQLYNQQKNAVMQLIKVFQGRFPGTNSEIPKDMFVTLPELKKDKYGVDLVNDGDLAFLNELPDKLEKLKTVFKQQQTESNRAIDEYIGKQKTAMKEQKARWDKFGKECTRAIDQSSKAINDQNQKMQQGQAESDGQVAEYCQKYYGLIDNPMPCDDIEDLASKATQAANRISYQALDVTKKFKNVCNAYNNEKDLASPENCSDYETSAEKASCERRNRIKESAGGSFGRSTPKKKKSTSLPSLCADGSDTKDKSFIHAAAKKLSDEVSGELEDVTNIAELKKIIPDIEDNGFFESILDITNLASADSEEITLCKKLYAIKDDKKDESVSAKTSSIESDIEKINEKLKKLNSENPDGKNKDDINELEIELKLKKLEISKLKEKTPTTTENDLNEILALLDPIEPNAREQYEEKFKNIGEQINGPCEAMNSNMMNGGGMLNMPGAGGYDPRLMGRAR